MSAWLPFAAMLLMSPQDTATFSSPQLRLLFNYPKTWKMESKKDLWTFTIPLDAGTNATLEVRPVSFESEKERWQTIQAQFAQQLGKEVERQWEEVVLGVPMLFTRVRGLEGGQPAVAMTGLMYNAASRKMLVKLWSAPDRFNEAESLFREVLNTLRTADGRLPATEDPTKPPEDIANRPLPPKTLPKKLEDPKPTVTVVKGPVSVPAKVAQRDAVLRMPEGWTATAAEDSLHLTHPEWQGAPLKVSLHSSLDSGRAESAVVKASARSLELFKTVGKRIDSGPRKTLSGATLFTVWRNGVSESGDLTTFEAAGAVEDLYWLIEHRWDAKDVAPALRRLLNTLIEGMSLEVGE